MIQLNIIKMSMSNTDLDDVCLYEALLLIVGRLKTNFFVHGSCVVRFGNRSLKPQDQTYQKV